MPHYIVDEPWAKVPLSLVEQPGVTLSEIRLYVYLDGIAGRRGWWYGRQDEITAAIGMPERTIQRAAAALVEAGFIAVERLGADHATVNRYLILARTVALGAHGRPATDGGSLALDGGSHPPTVAAPTSHSLTDPEPQIRMPEVLPNPRRRHGDLERVIRRT